MPIAFEVYPRRHLFTRRHRFCPPLLLQLLPFERLRVDVYGQRRSMVWDSGRVPAERRVKCQIMARNGVVGSPISKTVWLLAYSLSLSLSLCA